MQQDKPITESPFVDRHIGPTVPDQQIMLRAVGVSSIEELMQQVVPESIRIKDLLDLPEPMDEAGVLAHLESIADSNTLMRSYIGQGYYGTHTPHVILRNVLENPAWYTAYTPYQPEISQGRLEAILNFQTMVSELTGLEIANASLLDEGTAAAEAMAMAWRISGQADKPFFVSSNCHPQTLEVLRTRARGLGIELRVANELVESPSGCFGILLQYPHSLGAIEDYRAVTNLVHEEGGIVACATDLLALTLLTPPGQWGADIVVGSSQRFGVPLSYGGPHAAFMACRDAFKRHLPGRLVGVSRDAMGKPALRLALQTREQHIRREKATSNICTAQVLLAVMSSMYAIWHGDEGLKRIARRIHAMTVALNKGLRELGFTVVNQTYFDTLLVRTSSYTTVIHELARSRGINLREVDGDHLAISLDETVTEDDLKGLLAVFEDTQGQSVEVCLNPAQLEGIPGALLREGPALTHPVFSSVHSETDMLRYLRRLADKDLALDRTMIPLGSCTMKLNATVEMIPITWKKFSGIHPFVPSDQAQGYRELIEKLSQYLCEVTGYDAVSLQPNSGAQGEYAGLMAIRAYHDANGQHQRNICLIPSSAHGTNPASAQMVGMEVVVVAVDSQGNVDLQDLRKRIDQAGDRLAALMITYPSTHGVFEESIEEICDLVHQAGGQVYLDGANMNAMVGVAKPGLFGSDVSHLNLHKTFCIPHGGGGPGVGPVAVKAHLAPYLPGVVDQRGILPSTANVGPVSAAPFGSAGILPISYAYILLMGGKGLLTATQMAILNANYVAARLAPFYPVLYRGKHGRVAHECILDIRPIKDKTGISAEDIAKRLMDYGFHAPTMSFPVPGTLMVEPTESESLAELDRFVDAMISIRQEIEQIEQGQADPVDNVLKNAPHPAEMLLADDWTHSYSRTKAAYPTQFVRQNKYWPPVARVDNAWGDRNLMCTCPPMDSYSN